MTYTSHNLIYSVSTTKAYSILLQVKFAVLDEATHVYEASLNLYQYYRSNLLFCFKQKNPTLLQTILLAKTIKSTEKLMDAESLNLLPLTALPLFLFPYKYLEVFQAWMSTGIFLLGMQVCSCFHGWCLCISLKKPQNSLLSLKPNSKPNMIRHVSNSYFVKQRPEKVMLVRTFQPVALRCAGYTAAH